MNDTNGEKDFQPEMVEPETTTQEIATQEIATQEIVEDIKDAPLKQGYIELVYGVLISPVSTFKKITENVPLFNGFLIFLTVILLNSVMNIITPTELSGIPKEYSQILPKIGPIVVAIGIFTSLLFWFVEAGVLQVMAELLGGRGKAISVLTVIALADVPKVLIIPFQVIKYLTGGSTWSVYVYNIISIIVVVWGLILLLLGIRETQQISTGRAVTTILTPLALAILLIVLLAIGFAAVLLPYIQNLGV